MAAGDKTYQKVEDTYDEITFINPNTGRLEDGLGNELPLTFNSDGTVTVHNNIIPDTDNVYTLGSPTKAFKDVYIGPGSLYINGKKVIDDQSDTITVQTDVDQDLRIETSGAGVIELLTGATGIVEMRSTMQMLSGKRITDSAGIQVEYGDNIHMNANKISGVADPVNAQDAVTKSHLDSVLTGYTPDGHTHVEADITDLQNYSLVGHSHTESDITDLGDYMPKSGGTFSGPLAI